MVVWRWGLGRGFSMQNFRPFHRSSSVPGGGVFTVQRLWHAVWLARCSMKNCDKGICCRTKEALFHGGKVGLVQRLYFWELWVLFSCLWLLMVGGRGCGDLDVGGGVFLALTLCLWMTRLDLGLWEFPTSCLAVFWAWAFDWFWGCSCWSCGFCQSSWLVGLGFPRQGLLG